MPIDVVQVAFDDASRSVAQNKAHNTVAAMGIGFDGSGFDMARQRVVLYMVNPSPEALEELAERLDLSEVCVDLTVAPESPPAGPLQALPGHDLADPPRGLPERGRDSVLAARPPARNRPTSTIRRWTRCEPNWPPLVASPFPNADGW